MNSIIFETEKKDGTFRTWRNVAIPVKYGQLLDEQLDYAVVSLIRVKRKIFKPLTRARITIVSNTLYGGTQSKTIDYFIANDQKTETPVGSGIYNHELSLIELTKYLECFPVESLCFTNPNGTSGEIKRKVSPAVNFQYNAYPEDIPALVNFENNVKTPMYVGDKFIIPSVQQYWNNINDGRHNLYPGYATRDIPSTVYVYRNGQQIAEYTTYNGIFGTENPVGSGNYEVYEVDIAEGETRFEFYILGTKETSYSVQIFSFIIEGVANRLPLAPWTEEKVTQRLLDIVEPLRKNDTPRFVLNTENKSVFQNLAPEYTFTRMNLRECLQMQGGRIHGEPRLTINAQGQNEVSFDWYGGREYAKIINYKKGRIKPLNTYKYITSIDTWDIEQSANRMESYMDNLVSRMEWQSSSIGQPFEPISNTTQGGQSLRTETYTQFNESDNAYFPSKYPIDRPVKLEIYVDTGNTETTGYYDITAFLYESTVYKNLSGYKNSYPSKSFAVYYTQGAKDIKGLFYKVPNAEGGTTVNYSIVNIVQELAGVTIPTESYPSIAMRLTYVPIYSTKVTHGKQYLTDYLPLPRTLNYSQGANEVESRYFGQNIKSTVQRLGNIDKKYTFIVRNVNNVPTAGQLWDDEYYISNISVSVGKYLIHCTVGLSKHFNRKSQYIGANSYKRIYEVSETMVQQRHCVYTDYMVLKDVDNSTPVLTKQPYLSEDGVLTSIYMLFFTSAATSVEITQAQVTTYTKSQSVINTVLSPVISTAFGNTIEFTWEFKDNFSAGDKAEKQGQWVFSKGVEYGDYYGRAYYMSFCLYTKYKMDDVFTTITTPDQYPQATSPLQTVEVCGIPINDPNPIVLRKDSREALRMSYVLEFVAERGDYIIGASLAGANPLVSTKRQNPKLYILNRELGVFDDAINSEDIVEELELGDVNYDETKAVVEGNTSTEAGLSWCYAYPIVQGDGVQVEDEDGNETTLYINKGGDILFGKNVSISAGDTVGQCEFILVHDIYEYKKARNI